MKSVINEMHLWFIYLFEQQMDKNGYVKCFECGKKMHQDTYKHLTTCYSHILQKKTYPSEAGNVENVKIVHPNCHSLFSLKPKEAINQYNLYLKLKEKYNKND